MKLGNVEIGVGRRPFTIAEMSGNHNHSLTGADALKLQTYTPDTMTIDCREGEFFLQDKKSLWQGKSLYELYGEAMTPWEWHQAIYDRCKQKGILCFSTPFDETAVDFLEKLNTPFYKIASFENAHFPLIRKVAALGKPTIISLGMTTLQDIAELVDVYRSAGGKDLILLKCTSSYPARPEEANLLTIPNLRETFGVEVGLSDHTMGWTLPVVATTLGATVIEKHFTLRRADGGVDSTFSLEPEEFTSLVKETAVAAASLGKVNYGLTADESRSLVFRRSVYIVKDVQKGETFTTENLRIIRPGMGLAPKYLDQLIGRKARQNYKRGTAMDWSKVY